MDRLHVYVALRASHVSRVGQQISLGTSHVLVADEGVVTVERVITWGVEVRKRII